MFAASLARALGWLAFALASVGGVYGVTATALTVRFLRRPPPRTATPSAVSLIKPLHGDYPGMLGVLEGFCDQDYPAPVQIVFGVQDSADPAIAVVETLRARRPDADIELVIDGAQHGANRKVSNLINIAARARHGVLVLSDADIRVRTDYLRNVTGALAGEGVGAVTCLYVGESDGALWPDLAALALDLGFLPNAVLGKVLGLAQPCFGSTIALTTQTLAAIGGFAAFSDHLADDYEIGRAVRGLGLTIAIPPMTVAHLCLERHGRAMIDHELRWARTVRQIDPGGYAGSIVTYPLPMALLAGLLLARSAPGAALALICVILGVRIASKFAMKPFTGARAGHWWMIPARDVLSVCVFFASFMVDTVDWRGVKFRVERDGVLSHPKG